MAMSPPENKAMTPDERKQLLAVPFLPGPENTTTLRIDVRGFERDLQRTRGKLQRLNAEWKGPKWPT